MIDFRYHLVSLISVFLALAVGVILGAGPLQNSLGAALTDQVTSLREDRNTIQAKLEQTEAAVNDRDDYITASAAAFLPGTLPGRRVALVTMPGTETDDVDAVIVQLQTAGAEVVVRVALTEVWADPGREAFRSTYAGQFAAHLSGQAPGTGNEVLGRGLAAALTGADNAPALMDLLTASTTPLMSVETEPEEAADSIVIVGPRTTAVAGTEPTAAPTDTSDPTSWSVALAGTAAGAPTVVVGAANVTTDLVAALRSTEAGVSTIDSVGQATAAVSAPLALAAVIGGTKGAYGFDEGAEAIMPPVPGA